MHQAVLNNLSYNISASRSHSQAQSPTTTSLQGLTFFVRQHPQNSPRKTTCYLTNGVPGSQAVRMAFLGRAGTFAYWVDLRKIESHQIYRFSRVKSLAQCFMDQISKLQNRIENNKDFSKFNL